MVVVEERRRDRRRHHQDRSHRVPGRAQRAMKRAQRVEADEDRTAKRRFETAAIHAGQQPGAGHGRGDDAGLPDVDVRAEGAGRAHRLRVLAHAEPDALRARGEPGGARGRRLGPGVQRGRRRVDRGAVDCSTPAITSSPATISTAARSGCSTRCSAASASASPTSTRAIRARSRPRSARARALLAGDADQPAAAPRRHPRRRARLRRARRPPVPSTTRS